MSLGTKLPKPVYCDSGGQGVTSPQLWTPPQGPLRLGASGEGPQGGRGEDPSLGEDQTRWVLSGGTPDFFLFASWSWHFHSASGDVRLDLERTHRLTRGPRGHLGGKLGGAEQVQGRGRGK